MSKALRFERSKIHERGSFLPLPLTRPDLWDLEMVARHGTAEVKNGQVVGYHFSVLQECRYAKAVGKARVWRTDILMLNAKEKCPTCGEHTLAKQYLVYPAKNGRITGNMDKFTADDIEWAKAESARCWAIAQEYPEAMEILYGR